MLSFCPIVVVGHTVQNVKVFDRNFCNLSSYRDNGIYPEEPVEVAEEAIDHQENEIKQHAD